MEARSVNAGSMAPKIGWEIHDNLCFVAYGYEHISLLVRLLNTTLATSTMVEQDRLVIGDMIAELRQVRGILAMSAQLLR